MKKMSPSVEVGALLTEAEVLVRAIEPTQAGSADTRGGARLRPSDLPRGLTSVWQRRGGNANGSKGEKDANAGANTDNGIGSLIGRVMRARGLDDVNSADFLEPLLTHMHEPSLMPGMDRAAERLLRAAREGESIAIYGDYDVDGVSATTILYHVLKAIAPDAKLTTYVPHRVEEGYGLNCEAIRELATGLVSGAASSGIAHSVIVSVDCGVTAVEPARIARELGVDLIITDHHNMPEAAADGSPGLPDAYAIVHPRLGTDGRENGPGTYPFGELCGAGVAFKLAWRLATMASGSSKVAPALRQLLLDMLALASLGVVADVVPLLGENRVMARHGLRRIKGSTLVGLRALVEASGLSGDNVDAVDVGFKLGPRLNACGRMGHAREAVELFTTATPERAQEIAEGLTTLNTKRRSTEVAILKRAVEMAEEAGMTLPGRRAIVLAHRDWHAGVVGIVCSRMVEKFHRPTILMAAGEGGCHGSGRSVDGFSLHRALLRCAKHLAGFGGHDMAAGVRVAHENVARFAEAFIEVANEEIGESDLVSVSEFDVEGRIQDMSLAQVQALEQLAPFGRSNPSPIVRLRGVRIETRPETFGKYNKHLSFRVSEVGKIAPQLRLVGWNWAGQIDRVPRGAKIEALIKPRVSIFAGNANVEGEIVDVLVE